MPLSVRCGAACAAALVLSAGNAAFGQAKTDYVWHDTGNFYWGLAKNWRLDGKVANSFPDAAGAVAWLQNLTKKWNNGQTGVILRAKDYKVGTLILTQNDQLPVRIASQQGENRALIMDGGGAAAAVEVRAGQHEFKTTMSLQTDLGADVAAGLQWTFLSGPGLAGTINDTPNPGRTLTKTGAGEMRLLAPNPDFKGPISVDAGILTAGANRALGSIDGSTTVKAGATLRLISPPGQSLDYDAKETVFLNGDGAVIDGNPQGALQLGQTINDTKSLVSFHGPIVLQSDSSIRAGGAGVLALKGEISEAGGARALTGRGGGTIRLDAKNTYTGLTNLIGGATEVRANGALGGTGEGGRTIVGTDATLRFAPAPGDNLLVYSDAEIVELEGSAGLGIWEGSAAFAGPIRLTRDGNKMPTLFAEGGRELALSGVISDKDPQNPVDGVRKVLKGKVTLTGASTYSGKTLIEDGELHFQGGSLSAGGGSVDVSGKGQLTGYGNLNGRKVNGSDGIPIVKPKAQGMNLQGPDQLAIGELSLNAGSYVGVIDGPLDGQYGQLGLGGLGDINGSRLNIELGYVPSPGDTITIIDNDSGQPILGMFAGVSYSSPNWPGGIKGASFEGQLYRFGISYEQPDFGRYDVILTAIPAPGTATILVGLAPFLRRRR